MEVMFSPVSVCWLVCQQDYTKTTENISRKLGWRTGLDPELPPMPFVADLDEVMHPGYYSHLIKFSKIVLHLC